MKQVAIFCLIASVFWFVMFSPWTAGVVDFWFMMMAATGLLAGGAVWFGRDGLGDVWGFKIEHLFVGLAGAFLLYVIFRGCDLLFEQLLSFSARQVESIYEPRGKAGLFKIGLMLLLWIGPAEEVFWRGFVQRRLGERFGEQWGYIWAVAIYSLVHVWGFNLMLAGAAMVGGVVWGAMYYRFRSVWPGIICHALWDVAIFVVWPIG